MMNLKNTVRNESVFGNEIKFGKFFTKTSYVVIRKYNKNICNV